MTDAKGIALLNPRHFPFAGATVIAGTVKVGDAADYMVLRVTSRVDSVTVSAQDGALHVDVNASWEHVSEAFPVVVAATLAISPNYVRSLTTVPVPRSIASHTKQPPRYHEHQSECAGGCVLPSSER